MFANIVFALKMLAVTLVILFFMQIRIGSATIEDRAYFAIHSSTLTSYLNQVAQGGVKLWSEAMHKIKGDKNSRAQR